jgi:hypothetical protein
MQVVSCAFNGQVGALVWIPGSPGIAPGFAFGCADGSIHVYQRIEAAVGDHVIIIDWFWLMFVFQTQYQYLTEELVHNGPILDLKFDAKFGRLASVGSGFVQVSQLLVTDGGEHIFRFCTW